MPAQFDHAGQLAPILAGLADRKGSCFIDGEHSRSLDLSAWQEQAEDSIRQRYPLAPRTPNQGGKRESRIACGQVGQVYFGGNAHADTPGRFTPVT